MAKNNNYQNTAGQYIGNTPIDAYNFYKKNEQAAQDAISSLNFNSMQETSANIGNGFISEFQGNIPQNGANTVQTKTILGMQPSLLKGLLVGAGIALVATNPKVQKTVVGTAIKVWSGMQESIEEMKEQVNDAKAELAQED